MRTSTVIYYLTRLGLPCGNATQRSTSVRIFQQGFAFYDIDVDGDPGPQTHAAFVHSAKNGYRISPHFKLSEFRCGCRGRYHDRRYPHVHRALVRALERARAKHYPGGLTVVSGWRCSRFNKAVGGVSNSAHLTGRAADIPAKAGPQEFFNLGFHGIGYRSHGKVTHVDVDGRLRPNTAFKE